MPPLLLPLSQYNIILSDSNEGQTTRVVNI